MLKQKQSCWWPSTEYWGTGSRVVFWRRPDIVKARSEVSWSHIRLQAYIHHHIQAVSAAATASTKAIGRLMSNVSSPSAVKRKLLSTVVTTRLLNAAPVWATSASKHEINREILARAQRLTALRITRCYWHLRPSPNCLPLTCWSGSGRVSVKRRGASRVLTSRNWWTRRG